MIQVNLLPWREEARKLKQRKFYILGILFFFLFILISLSWHLYYSNLLHAQMRLNEYLDNEIQTQTTMNAAYDEKIKKRLNLESQLRYIGKLLQQGYGTVVVLNELMAIVPNSIFLVTVSKEDHAIRITGRAQSDSDITLFKQAIQNSSVFTQASLTISSNEKGTTRNFEMNFRLKDTK